MTEKGPWCFSVGQGKTSPLEKPLGMVTLPAPLQQLGDFNHRRSPLSKKRAGSKRLRRPPASPAPATSSRPRRRPMARQGRARGCRAKSLHEGLAKRDSPKAKTERGEKEALELKGWLPWSLPKKTWEMREEGFSSGWLPSPGQSEASGHCPALHALNSPLCVRANSQSTGASPCHPGV